MYILFYQRKLYLKVLETKSYLDIRIKILIFKCSKYQLKNNWHFAIYLLNWTMITSRITFNTVQLTFPIKSYFNDSSIKIFTIWHKYFILSWLYKFSWQKNHHQAFSITVIHNKSLCWTIVVIYCRILFLHLFSSI